MTGAVENDSSRRYLVMLLLPLIVVILASLYTIAIALRQADRPVAENYTKNGLTIQAGDAAIQRGQMLGLNVALDCEENAASLVLDTTSGSFAAPATLNLRFVHKVDPALDRDFQLQGRDGHYALAPLPVTDVAGYWLLGDKQRTWSLRMAAPLCAGSNATASTVVRSAQ